MQPGRDGRVHSSVVAECSPDVWVADAETASLPDCLADATMAITCVSIQGVDVFALPCAMNGCWIVYMDSNAEYAQLP